MIILDATILNNRQHGAVAVLTDSGSVRNKKPHRPGSKTETPPPWYYTMERLAKAHATRLDTGQGNRLRGQTDGPINYGTIRSAGLWRWSADRAVAAQREQWLLHRMCRGCNVSPERGELEDDEEDSTRTT